jgi:hypothetical protein
LKPTHRSVDNTKKDVHEIECEGADWIQLARDRDQWRAVIYTVMTLEFHKLCGTIYWGADKSLARPTSRCCILFDGDNISFDSSLVMYIYI